MGASKERPDSYPPSVCFFSSNAATAIDGTLDTAWGDAEALYIMVSQVFSGFNYQANVAKVAVKDSGIGITEEGQAKLFERFNQATPKTQGLFISLPLLHSYLLTSTTTEKYGGSGKKPA